MYLSHALASFSEDGETRIVTLGGAIEGLQISPFNFVIFFRLMWAAAGMESSGQDLLRFDQLTG